MSTVVNLKIDDEYDVIKANNTVQEASRVMKINKVPDLVVIEGEGEIKRVLGIISLFEIVMNVVAEGLDPSTTLVHSVMYQVTPISINTTVQETFELLQELDIPLIPVVENGILLGVVTIGDCWGFLLDQKVK